MNDTKHSGPADVLAVLKRHVTHAKFQAAGRPHGHAGQDAPTITETRKAMAAVAELIEADRAYDTARSRYNAAFQNGPHGDIAEQRWAQEQLNDAKGRRSAALTNIRSAP